MQPEKRSCIYCFPPDISHQLFLNRTCLYQHSRERIQCERDTQSPAGASCWMWAARLTSESKQKRHPACPQLIAALLQKKEKSVGQQGTCRWKTWDRNAIECHISILANISTLAHMKLGIQTLEAGIRSETWFVPEDNEAHFESVLVHQYFELPKMFDLFRLFQKQFVGTETRPLWTSAWNILEGTPSQPYFWMKWQKGTSAWLAVFEDTTGLFLCPHLFCNLPSKPFSIILTAYTFILFIFIYLWWVVRVAVWKPVTHLV